MLHLGLELRTQLFFVRQIRRKLFQNWHDYSVNELRVVLDVALNFQETPLKFPGKFIDMGCGCKFNLDNFSSLTDKTYD